MPPKRKGPSGPEDSTPGAEFVLTRDQFDTLCRVVPKKHGAIRLRDLGAAWAQAETLDAEGRVIDSWRLPPVGVNVSERTRRRAIERAAKESEARLAEHLANFPEPDDARR
jgi:hypothetical protein